MQLQLVPAFERLVSLRADDYSELGGNKDRTGLAMRMVF